jgi:hypothetical protein
VHRIAPGTHAIGVVILFWDRACIGQVVVFRVGGCSRIEAERLLYLAIDLIDDRRLGKRVDDAAIEVLGERERGAKPS